ncbi:redox-regulated ATPase YchF [Candidatus Methylomirabilis limnetica]|uniref:Redox-regulated ATPase YchF n=1 Tax=Candidatus Methylomirabilis limnetica TaxID=2033718 RepID=A0A2T4U0J8_9BACT|nr:redox-regulated ATPase YchF [Candidatus Methylomirabilis limnetica]PTL36879.1 redox-regulated ATPase YchF [Candidatus Methylomirabilis limnetica]
MRIGIIGLPASGKSTVYQLLTHGQPSHHAGQLEASISVVKVPDPRLDRLALMFKPKKLTPASFELVDFAPLVKESGKPTSPGGQLLPQMRQTTTLLMVVRAFEDERVPHIEGRVDPAKDADTLQAELILADLDVVEKRIAKIEEAMRKGKKGESPQELALLKRCYAALQEEKPLRGMALTAEDERLLRGFQFLMAKPSLLVVNTGEEADGGPDGLKALPAMGASQSAPMAISAKLELELADLPPDEASAFCAELGLGASAAPRLRQACYDLLGLTTFFTVGSDEVRAWMIPHGSTAMQAAGAIHSDLEHGFIRAEVVAYEALDRCGSLATARNQGLLRLEGKEYLVADGDIMTIRFNV